MSLDGLSKQPRQSWPARPKKDWETQKQLGGSQGTEPAAPERYQSSFLVFKEHFVGLGKHELIYGYRIGVLTERKERQKWRTGQQSSGSDKRCGPELTEKGLAKWQHLPEGAGEHGSIPGDSLSLP